MDFNSLFFRAPKPTYSIASISLLPNSELIWVSRQIDDVVSCTCSISEAGGKVRKIPILLSKPDQVSNRYLLYFHAMAEDMKDAYDFILPLQNKLGVNIVLVEYPGYGIYEGHEPSAETITEDAESVMNYLLMKRRIGREDIVVMGRSMGTGPACFLAAKSMPRALILMSPFTSLRGVAENFVGSVLSKIVSERFQNLEVIAKVQIPLLIIHGLKDEMIPKDHSLQLLAAAQSRVKLFHFSQNMTHNKFDYESDFQNQVETLLKKINFVQEAVVQIQPLKGTFIFKSQKSNTYVQKKPDLAIKFSSQNYSVDDSIKTPPTINFYKRPALTANSAFSF